MKRRTFLLKSALASGSLYAPAFLKSFKTKLESSRSGKNLIVIQLSGGNDGLNTIIPFRDDLYYKMRPFIGLKKDKLIDLNGNLGFNKGLQAIKEIYDQGEMAIINNVGYPNPDRSHFRSMDIWQTGSASNEYLSTGWIGRYLDNDCHGCESNTHALEIDNNLSLAMKGIEESGFAVSNPTQLKKNTNNEFLKAVAKMDHDHEHENVAYLYKTLIDTQESADYLHRKVKNHKSSSSFPNTKFGKKLKTVSELMTSDTDTKIYYVSLSGFDTHAFQMGKQERLLQQYAEAVKALVSDLKKNNLFDDTLIMTFSEFGRRVKQNASKGTDHGTANVLFLMGGGLKKKGILNKGPNLSKLVDGDLQYTVDFRSIYATILDKWLGTNHSQILGHKFQGLDFV